MNMADMNSRSLWHFWCGFIDGAGSVAHSYTICADGTIELRCVLGDRTVSHFDDVESVSRLRGANVGHYLGATIGKRLASELSSGSLSPA